MVCLIHWAILYDFGSRHFSFNPSPFYNRLLSERGLFCRVSCTRGVPAACCSGPLSGHGMWYRTNLCLHHCRTGLRTKTVRKRMTVYSGFSTHSNSVSLAESISSTSGATIVPARLPLSRNGAMLSYGIHLEKWFCHQIVNTLQRFAGNQIKSIKFVEPIICFWL